MPVHKPNSDHVYQFIAESHLVEKLPCTMHDVLKTVSSPAKNWYADGHLRAISKSIKLVESTDFPTRFPTLTNRFQSNEALHWLRSLHLTMLEPIARNPKDVLNNSNANEINQQETPKIEYLGIWRPQPASNLYCSAPPAQLIIPIMHNWLTKLKAIHDKVRDRLDNPYGIQKAEFRLMKEFIEQQPIFFSSVQPFKDANNRFGRLVENVLRLAWRFPFNFNIMNQYEDFKDNLEPFQVETLPKIVKAARELAH